MDRRVLLGVPLKYMKGSRHKKVEVYFFVLLVRKERTL